MVEGRSRAGRVWRAGRSGRSRRRGRTPRVRRRPTAGRRACCGRYMRALTAPTPAHAAPPAPDTPRAARPRSARCRSRVTCRSSGCHNSRRPSACSRRCRRRAARRGRRGDRRRSQFRDLHRAAPQPGRPHPAGPPCTASTHDQRSVAPPDRAFQPFPSPAPAPAAARGRARRHHGPSRDPAEEGRHAVVRPPGRPRQAGPVPTAGSRAARSAPAGRARSAGRPGGRHAR